MRISRDDYRDKVYGCWAGKCLGGAVGMPFEGVPFRPELRPDNINVQDVPNDDLELQLVWLALLERHGLKLNSNHLASCWMEHIKHGCDEYSIAIRNLRRGIMPPASGQYDNFFHDGMGCAIRSEIWAAAFPGRPDAAGYFAAGDAVVDHWGDGVWAEAFLAMAESQLFITGDIAGSLKFAMARLPEDSRLYQRLAVVFELHEQRFDADAAGAIILRRLYHHNFADCVMNLGFIAFALLWGEYDFVKTILLAINCGRDTDCTAATCGAFLGIARGSKAIPADLLSRMSPELKLSETISKIHGLPRTLQELIDRTVALEERFAAEIQMSEYPAYIPLQPIKPAKFDKAQWLVLDESKHDISAVKELLLNAGACPEELKQHVVTSYGLQLDVSSYAGNANMLNLFTFLEVEHPDAERDEIMVSATADVGMTLWFDRVRMLNHHSRQLSIPSFHRAEGGAAFHYPLQHGERKLVHIKLYSCLAPLHCTLMFGNKFNDHLDGFNLSI